MLNFRNVIELVACETGYNALQLSDLYFVAETLDEVDYPLGNEDIKTCYLHRMLEQLDKMDAYSNGRLTMMAMLDVIRDETVTRLDNEIRNTPCKEGHIKDSMIKVDGMLLRYCRSYAYRYDYNIPEWEGTECTMMHWFLEALAKVDDVH